MRQVSLQQLTLRYSLLVLSIVILLTLVSFISIKSIIDRNYEEKQRASLQVKAFNISNTLSFYQNTVNKLAKETEVIDLVQFADEEHAQAWALKMQRLLPDSVSLALFNESGEIFGQKDELRVGDVCLADLQHHISNEPIISPPVHANNPAFAHFDLLSNISDGDENIGVLFASFELTVLQKLLDQLTEEGQHLQLFTGNHITLVETNHFSRKNINKDDILFFSKLPINNSDWFLVGNIERNQLADVMIFTAITNGVLFILISLVFIGFSGRLVKAFSSDFNIIHNLLTSLKDDEKKTPDTKTRLIETEKIVNNIKGVAGDIYDYQEQLLKYSQCDDLTGLLNRRGFYNEAPRSIDLAKRSVETTLVLLDIDFFKQMNDQMGHAAGDEVLKMLSDCITSTSRSVDITARIGGDEFVIILVKCPENNAINWYEKISNAFQQQQKALNLPENVKFCTLSAGYSEIQATDTEISDVMARADEALYSAKAMGRSNIKGQS
ncbi:hypothetical protein MNBD_GAMMA09-2925 [hydrothermal vent metagenome]|uniref:GGDEF domain-containing protein n=1 Tax=hydrothermal vent metagenome TaxID=652676 RepID=A0A3B0XKU4_9ZZZZ